MEAKKIIQSGYSIILYKILNEVRRDDDGDCDIDCCATFRYEYYDHFLSTYMPFDKLDDYNNMRGAFYITFYVVFATQWWMFLLLPFHFL
jgi:hypothetical protein